MAALLKNVVFRNEAGRRRRGHGGIFSVNDFKGLNSINGRHMIRVVVEFLFSPILFLSGVRWW
ncbi:hypothetical protein [Methylobacterium sp. B4]|uniref:hypothetical protein n=1 Tax=Methylobacterium sp. B4 TaxID=1938755 RepID=UPI0011B61C55|nr:hypothetical protein [Methylobacterium sp. B4]